MDQRRWAVSRIWSDNDKLQPRAATALHACTSVKLAATDGRRDSACTEARSAGYWARPTYHTGEANKLQVLVM